LKITLHFFKYVLSTNQHYACAQPRCLSMYQHHSTIKEIWN